jgi:hypothetical protein
MDAIVLRDKPTDDKCNNCSLIYITNGIIYNGIRHVLVKDTVDNKGCGCCSMDTQCIGENSGICVRMFYRKDCHFEIK